MLSLDKSPSPSSDPSSSPPSSVQVNKNKKTNPQPAASSSDSPVPPSSTFDIPRSASVSAQDVMNRRKEANDPLGPGGRGGGLALSGRSSSNLAISGSQQYLAGGKELTPSIASDISNPYATQELQQRLAQLQK